MVSILARGRSTAGIVPYIVVDVECYLGRGLTKAVRQSNCLSTCPSPSLALAPVQEQQEEPKIIVLCIEYLSRDKEKKKNTFGALLLLDFGLVFRNRRQASA